MIGYINALDLRTESSDKMVFMGLQPTRLHYSPAALAMSGKILINNNCAYLIFELWLVLKCGLS